MTQPESTLTPQQAALQQLALRQLEAVSETLRRLQAVTIDRGDVEAVQDAAGSVAASVALLREWYGTEPADD